MLSTESTRHVTSQKAPVCGVAGCAPMLMVRHDVNSGCSPAPCIPALFEKLPRHALNSCKFWRFTAARASWRSVTLGVVLGLSGASIPARAAGSESCDDFDASPTASETLTETLSTWNDTSELDRQKLVVRLRCAFFRFERFAPETVEYQEAKQDYEIALGRLHDAFFQDESGGTGSDSTGPLNDTNSAIHHDAFILTSRSLQIHWDNTVGKAYYRRLALWRSRGSYSGIGGGVASSATIYALTLLGPRFIYGSGTLLSVFHLLQQVAPFLPVAGAFAGDLAGKLGGTHLAGPIVPSPAQVLFTDRHGSNVKRPLAFIQSHIDDVAASASSSAVGILVSRALTTGSAVMAGPLWLRALRAVPTTFVVSTAAWMAVKTIGEGYLRRVQEKTVRKRLKTATEEFRRRVASPESSDLVKYRATLILHNAASDVIDLFVTRTLVTWIAEAEYEVATGAAHKESAADRSNAESDRKMLARLETVLFSEQHFERLCPEPVDVKSGYVRLDLAPIIQEIEMVDDTYVREIVSELISEQNRIELMECLQKIFVQRQLRRSWEIMHLRRKVDA